MPLCLVLISTGLVETNRHKSDTREASPVNELTEARSHLTGAACVRFRIYEGGCIALSTTAAALCSLQITTEKS